MWKVWKVAAAVAVAALMAAGSAYALHLRAGNLIVDGDGSFHPTALPQNHNAPIRVSMHGSIKTVDGSRPSPLRELVLEVDRHSAPETRGLPRCTRAKLIATTTKQARRLCPGAILGTGFGTVLVGFPEQDPIAVSSPITIFNGPEKNGNPTAIGHAHLDYPSPATYLAGAEIQEIDRGRYGHKIVIDFPRILNGYGSPVYGRIEINRRWQYRGRTLSVANARCADGRLQARIQAAFEDGTLLQGTAFKRCTVKER
jgi:hypothetical protein